MDDLNVSANLTEMLEKLEEEQDQLSLRVKEKLEEKNSWERKVGALRVVLENEEMELNKVKKEGIIVEDELRMKVRLQKMLMGDLEQVGQGEPVFGIKQKTEKLEAMKRKVEKLEISRRFIEEEKMEMDRRWNDFSANVKKVEDLSGIGKELLDVRRTGKFLEDKLTGLVEANGSIEFLEANTDTLTLEVNQIFEEKWQVEEECQMYQQVIRERKGIISRMEIEARMAENRLLAQKRRLSNMLESLKASENK